MPPACGPHDARMFIVHESIDGFEREQESRALTAITGIEAEAFDDGAAVEAANRRDAPSLGANANEITGTDADVRRSHAP